MKWDSIAVARRFLQHANSIHPEEAETRGEHDRQLAVQTLLYECYMSSFSEEKLIEVLQQSVSNNFKIPEEVNEAEFRSAYIATAQKLLKEYKG